MSVYSRMMLGLGLSAVGVGAGCVDSMDDATSTDREEIVGGVATTVGANPWQVALTTLTGGQFCGGSIVSSEWVATAQHCVEGGNSAFRVVGGITALNQQASGQIRQFNAIATAPTYIDPTTGDDVALLHVTPPFTFNANVQAIPLLTAADAAAGATDPGRNLRVTGWGSTREGGAGSNTLLTVDVPIVSNEQTSQLYGLTITPDQLAAGVVPAGGRDSCQGDSGGPATVDVNGVRKLAGAVSWGNGCARGQFPGLYARISEFPSFIPTNVNGRFTQLLNLTGVSGARGSFTHRSVTVPAGTQTLSVIVRGGTGDGDLFIRNGAQPTAATFVCRPFLDGNSEFCTVNNPVSGTWFVSIQGFSAYSGATLSVATVGL